MKTIYLSEYGEVFTLIMFYIFPNFDIQELFNRS